MFQRRSRWANHRRNVSNHPANDFTTPQGSPPIAWSPEGQKIAFLSDRDERDGSEIYVARVDGGNAARLTNRPGIELNPQWSSDGFCLTYYDMTQGRIYIVGVDGQRTEPLYTLLR